MSIEADLRKNGIRVVEPLDNSSVISVAQFASQKLFETFADFGFTYENLLETFSNVPMYIANIPNGMSEASYFYKNSSIYFRDGMGLNDLQKYSVHELIHHIQAVTNSRGNLIRLGLCEFKGSKAFGIALNEAAVQIMASNTLNQTFENVEYYGLSFSTISPNLYPLICNLVMQMAYVTGENILFESTINSTDSFKNKFIAICGKNTFNTIVSNLDKILHTEECIIKLNNILQTKDLSIVKATNITEKITNLKKVVKDIYLRTQELIISSYFNTSYSALYTSTDIENFRKNLYNYQELIGSTANYYFYNSFYIEMMEKIDNKFEEVSGSTYLIPKKTNKLLQVITYLRRLILKKEFEREE